MNDSLKRTPLVSVVVPIFNVECFLDECLKSICDQTYENLEIILVNDGSTDNSQTIIDHYSKIDKRIVSVKQANKGLSAARNTGINLATGEFITFVDSDDLLFRDAIFFLLKHILDYNSDIAICSHYCLKDNKLYRPFLYKSEKVEVLNKEKLMQELALCEKVQNFAWGKLYKTRLFDDIRFPEGKYFEDQFIMMHLLFKCEKGIFIDDPKYIYRFNEKSISRSLTKRKILDYGAGFLEKAEFYSKVFPDFIPLMLKNANSVLVEIRNRYPIIFDKEIKHLYKQLKRTIFCKVQNNLSRILKIPLLSTICLRLIQNKKIKLFIAKIIFKDKKPNLKAVSRKKDNAIFYFGSPEYDNIGDHAIYLSSKAFFNQRFPEYDFFSYTEKETNSCLNRIFKNIKKNDIVVIQGGGNIGSLYSQEPLRRKILKKCKRITTFIMPSSIFFSEDKHGRNELKKSKSVYDACSNLTVITRDIFSFDFAKRHFSCNVLCYPDIVFSLVDSLGLDIKCGIAPLMCLRDDIESKLDYPSKINIYNKVVEHSPFFYSDDTSTGYLIPENSGEVELRKTIDIFNNSKYIVTDRLHGMIISFLLNKKCIVFSNFDKKIEGSFKWIEDSKNIVFISDKNQFSNRFDMFLRNQEEKEKTQNLKEHFKKMEHNMREIIGNGKD